MGKQSKTRLVNGVVSACIVVFFLVHGVLGGASTVFGFSSPFKVVVWGGLVFVGVHVVLSIVTSAQQLGDAEHPPSARKKRHLALKWATGGLLAVAVALHVAGSLPVSSEVVGVGALRAVILAAVAACLAIHVCVGAKSLLSDIAVDKRFMKAFRIAVCVIVVLSASVAIIGALP